MSVQVFVLGAGRAGVGLARALRASGGEIEVVGVHGRHEPGGPDDVTVGPLPATLSRATVVLVTVRDAQIDDALHELAAAPLASGAVVLHASGSQDPAALAVVRARGHPAGTFHPLVPFADPARAPEMLRGAWIGIDGDVEACAAARLLARALGAHTLEIPPGEKPRYHAAAVIVSNFPAVLLALGERVLREAGLAPAIATSALRPLFFAAVDNLRARPGAQALTGPIVRGDVETVRRHLDALASDPDALATYRTLSRSALDLAAAAGTDTDKLEAIRRLVAPDAS
jgi:predicted short-subunit dehydrogenase-like oxidoreductase (DUF2520 family)